MVEKLSHTGICVSDLDRALTFYRDGLGFRYVSSIQVDGDAVDKLLRLTGVKLSAVYLERDGVRIELLHYASPRRRRRRRPRGMNQVGFTHLSFRVSDVEATLAGLRRSGATVLEDTVVRRGGSTPEAAFVTDPDGLLIELVRSR